MKRNLTLSMALLCSMACLAQEATSNKKAIKVDETMVFYLTNDTKTKTVEEVFDELTGDITMQEVDRFWQDALCVDAFNNCGVPLGGTSATEIQTKIHTRKDYRDPKTGFEMPAGSYRGVFIDNTLGFQGNLGNDNIIGYSNCKSMVMYFIPIPITMDNITEGRNIALNDYPTGRVQAKYVDAEGKAISNQAYREIHINMTDDPNYVSENPGTPVAKYHNIRGTKLLNFTRSEEDILDITVDQPYKVEVNLQNLHDGTYYNELFASDTKRSEFADYVCPDESTEAEMSYYFSDPTTNRPFADNPDNWTSCATGYDCVDQKWGTKVDWTPETIVNLAIKRRMYLVGIAIVSATEGAPSKFMNAADLTNAKWSNSAVAFGEHGSSSGISQIEDDSHSNNAIYNISGQKVGESYRGIVIQNGIKRIKK